MEAQRISAIVAAYNEHPQSIYMLMKCLLDQDYPLYEIIFIDDGSTRYAPAETAREFVSNIVWDEKTPNFIIHRMEKNVGKKKALAYGVGKATGKFLLLVDSDSQISQGTVKKLLCSFNDHKVYSCTGYIGVRNAKKNFVTRLQDIIYNSAFEMGRAAQSLCGDVVVCSGALSMHRTVFVKNHMEEFLQSRVMGVCCVGGDDRSLTDLAKRYGGKTKYQCTAVCMTDVPVTVGRFVNQQIRWTKSSYLYTLQTLKHSFPKNRLYVFWSVCETYLWLFCLILSMNAHIFYGFSLDKNALYSIAVYFVVISYINRVYYVLKNPWHYLLTPIYALVHNVLLFYIRITALCTLNRSNWSTR